MPYWSISFDNELFCESVSQLSLRLIGTVGEDLRRQGNQRRVRLFHSIQGLTCCSYASMLESCLCYGNIRLRLLRSASATCVRMLAQLQPVRVPILFLSQCDQTDLLDGPSTYVRATPIKHFL